MHYADEAYRACLHGDADANQQRSAAAQIALLHGAKGELTRENAALRAAVESLAAPAGEPEQPNTDTVHLARGDAERPASAPAADGQLRAIRLCNFINGAGINGSDVPHVVVEKLQAAIDAAPEPAPSQRELLREAAEALEMAHNGLQWYWDLFPKTASHSDAEADELITATLNKLREHLKDDKAGDAGVALPREGQS